MSRRVVEDRVLAQIAYRAAGRGPGPATEEAADVAYGQAVIALRVSGIAEGPETLRTLREDVEAIIADPSRMARAREMAHAADGRRPANANARPLPSARAM